MLHPIKCYCDASYDPKFRTAVIGWKIGDSNIHTLTIDKTNNIRAEILGFLDMAKNFHENTRENPALDI